MVDGLETHLSSEWKSIFEKQIAIYDHLCCYCLGFFYDIFLCKIMSQASWLTILAKKSGILLVIPLQTPQ